MTRGLRSALLAGMGLFLFASFQNCTGASQRMLFSNNSSESTSGQTTDSGVPYDGKIFVVSGEACRDGTTVHSRIVLRSSILAHLVRQECVDIAAKALSPGEWQYDPAKPSELVYQNKIYKAWIPENVGLGYGVLPKLNAPVDPTAYGAKGDGTTDNTSAFQKAVNAGDVLIPAGTYVVNGTVKVPAGRNIQCASPQSVKIINPTRNSGGNQTFQFWSAGGSLSNCSLAGSNQVNANGSAAFDQSMQYNYLVGIVDYFGVVVSDVRIVNNVFENCHGNACVVIYGGSGSGASNNSILYNTFRNCGYYGVVVDAGVNSLVAYNHVTDCSMGVQNDNVNQPQLNNIFDSNYLTVVNGNGQMVNNGGTAAWNLFLTGGVFTTSDYSSNLIRYNTISGDGKPNSFELLKTTTKPAQYIDNACVNGCFEN